VSGRRHPWVVLAVLGLALTLVAAACGGGSEQTTTSAASTTGATAARTLVVGDVAPFTGGLSGDGPPFEKAARMAQAQVDAALQSLGISDLTTSLLFEDEQTDPQAAVSSARLIVADGASCFVCCDASADTIPVGLSVAQPQGVPQISPSSSSGEITGLADDGYVFRIPPSNAKQGPVLVQVIADKIGGAEGKTLAIGARNDSYGEGLSSTVAAEWEARGGAVIGPVLYDPEQASYDAEANILLQDNPDALVILDFPETYGKVGAALLRTGLLDTSKLFVGEALAADTIPEGIPPEALIGATGTRPALPENSAAVTAFYDLYDNSPGTTAHITYEAHNFDATMMCYLGTIAAGSSDGAAIRDVLTAISGPPGQKYTFMELADAIQALLNGEDIDFDGVAGPIDWDVNGDPSSAIYGVFTYNANGELETVETIVFGG
jgi:ABC-type branched-subunit amino acid transport system substrate-binding protein